MSLDRLTLPELLLRAADTDRGVRFMDRRGRLTEYSYRALYGDAVFLASHFATRISRGDRVGLIFSTSYDLVRSLFGLAMAGAVPFCLPPPRLSRGSGYSQITSSMIRRAGASLVLCEASTRGSLEKVQAITQ